MAYVAEGLGNMLEWDDVRKFQRKNGSLFNSPSATAALLIHKYDVKAMQYLYLLVSRFCGSGGDAYLSMSRIFTGIGYIELLLTALYLCSTNSVPIKNVLSALHGGFT
jgi:ent-kaurene synthase